MRIRQKVQALLRKDYVALTALRRRTLPRCIHLVTRAFYKHQELLLPYTSHCLGKSNLDIGCGTGLTSVIHQEKLGISPTLCDVVDIRNALAQSLLFFLIHDTLPFEDKSSYIQYVFHDLQTSAAITRLLAEALRVSHRVIIVEEIKGDRTDVARAQQFDKDVNERIRKDTP
jgi:ubiquinone/menaquinone biosynthesis C-methylase UbiE